MHCFGAGLFAGLDDLLDHEIALGSLRRSDMHRLVRHLDMECIAVSIRIDGDRLDPHKARGFDDPAGDFAAICDQNFFEHAF